MLLAILPMMTVRLLGLPRPDSGFWPRVCGALLIGIAAALFLEGTSAGHGLGLAGVVVINLCGVALLSSMLVLDGGPASARGRTAVWLTVCLLVTLSVIEIAVL
ncbi:MAG: hypothetical protein WDN31_22415 [Hyphomicrobium sp.]